MLPYNTIPYDLIGFVTFWLTVSVVFVFGLLVLLLYTRSLILNQLQDLDDKLWEDIEKGSGERPKGKKGIATFYNHVLICLLSGRKPIAWRWSTYKAMVDDENKQTSGS